MKKVGLVLEGGGMRGLYTCGVLEYFLEKDLRIPYIIGVSAGACNGLSYASWQKGRNERVILDFVQDKHYMGIRSLVHTGNFFGMDFIFDTIPNQHVPFDHKTFQESPHRFVTVATNIETGESVYFEKNKVDKTFQVLRASSALPLLSKIVQIGDGYYMDGGISDSIPIERAIADGCEKAIVILTRNKGYIKKPTKGVGLLKMKYKNYPKLIEAMKNRHKNYNNAMEKIYALEKDGKVFIIQPSVPLVSGRTERNKEKLKNLFDQGYEDIKSQWSELQEFLK